MTITIVTAAQATPLINELAQVKQALTLLSGVSPSIEIVINGVVRIPLPVAISSLQTLLGNLQTSLIAQLAALGVTLA